MWLKQTQKNPRGVQVKKQRGMQLTFPLSLAAHVTSWRGWRNWRCRYEYSQGLSLGRLFYWGAESVEDWLPCPVNNEIQTPTRWDLPGPRGVLIYSLISRYHSTRSVGLIRPKSQMPELPSQNSAATLPWEYMDLVYADNTPINSTSHSILLYMVKREAENYFNQIQF